MPTEPAGAAPAGAAPAGVGAEIEMVDRATEELLAEFGGRTAADVARPSLCPGWTAGHILTHLARNADGLRRAAEGGRRGEVAPMYDSAQARDRDIEAGAGRSMAELAADVAESARALRAAWAAMNVADWGREMLHHRAGRLPLTATPGMRRAEVLIHHVDLGWSYGPDGWPAAFVMGVLADETRKLGQRLPDGVGLDLRATDTGDRWTAGSGAAGRVGVSGPSWAIACWLVGRPGPVRPALAAAGGALPSLRPWP